MDDKKLNYFKSRLIGEKKRIYKLCEQMDKSGTTNSNNEMSSELSFYDNHPADSATDIFDAEKGMALKQNEVSILNKIDMSLKSIDDGTYGKCKLCGKAISEERLEFIPYAQYCVSCQKKIGERKPIEEHDRPVEEEVLKKHFGHGYDDYNLEYDAENSYKSVDRFNRLRDVYEYDNDDDDDNYVELIEKVSNQQYKNQLPD